MFVVGVIGGAQGRWRRRTPGDRVTRDRAHPLRQ
jgi:hypothetical protein